MRKTRMQQIDRQDRRPTDVAPTAPHGSGQGYVDAREAAEMLGVGNAPCAT